MPRAIAVGTREVIIERHLAGVPLARIADEPALSPWTVRTIWRRYRDRGPAGLVPDYAACGRPGPRHPTALHETALALRRERPRWGAGLIRLHLAERFPPAALPRERTLRRWFAAAGLGTPQRPPPLPPPPRATHPHARWQLDAREQIRLADDRPVSWLSASDEASGGMLGTVVFPPGRLDAGRAA